MATNKKIANKAKGTLQKAKNTASKAVDEVKEKLGAGNGKKQQHK